jgi:hypothetical protein
MNVDTGFDAVTQSMVVTTGTLKVREGRGGGWGEYCVDVRMRRERKGVRGQVISSSRGPEAEAISRSCSETWWAGTTTIALIFGRVECRKLQ